MERQQQLQASALAEQRRREQEQRDQAVIAERIRQKNERDTVATAAAAGVDTIVPLDEWSHVNVGGSSVSVKVHDNDVTSFDIWINGAHYRDVRKNKGISGSRADETFVYAWNGAQLFYVWEISGKVNHCRLRVRHG